MEPTTGEDNSNDKSTKNSVQHNHKERYEKLVIFCIFLVKIELSIDMTSCLS